MLIPLFFVQLYSTPVSLHILKCSCAHTHTHTLSCLFMYRFIIIVISIMSSLQTTPYTLRVGILYWIVSHPFKCVCNAFGRTVYSSHGLRQVCHIAAPFLRHVSLPVGGTRHVFVRVVISRRSKREFWNGANVKWNRLCNCGIRNDRLLKVSECYCYQQEAVSRSCQLPSSWELFWSVELLLGKLNVSSGGRNIFIQYVGNEWAISV